MNVTVSINTDPDVSFRAYLFSVILSVSEEFTRWGTRFFAHAQNDKKRWIVRRSSELMDDTV